MRLKMIFFKKILLEIWQFLSVYRGYYKRHNLIYKAGLKKKKLTSSEKKEYLLFWGKVAPCISLKTVEISKSLSGKYNKYIVPEEFYSLYFETYFNSDKNVSFLQNKSIYNKWFEKEFFPIDYFHKIDNVYYTYNFQIIDDISNFIDKNLNNYPMVLKPNKDSYGGANVFFVKDQDELKELIINFKDIVVQEKINQSFLLNEFNEESVNTVRVCLYKDEHGLIHVLNTSLRMGKDGSLDNETAGGIVCNIKSTGFLNAYAVDKFAIKYFQHPNSGYTFENKEFPFYKELHECSKKIASQIMGVQLISLDMALDSNNEWRCIEINLFGQTIRFAQYAGEPFFGSLTEQIVNKIVATKKGKN